MIEQYRDDLISQLRGTADARDHEMTVAEGREAVASDLLNVLHSIPIQSIATNGPSLVGLSFFDTVYVSLKMSMI